MGTPVTPNHLTVLRLATGGLAAVLYAWGTEETRLYASFVFLASAFLDRADGELARLANLRSEWGHRLDLAADLASSTAFFIGLGIGFREGALGGWAVAMGLWTGAAICAIYWLRAGLIPYRRPGEIDSGPNRLVDADDFLYLVAPLTWLGWLEPLLVGASIGAPVFLLWVAREFLRARNGGATTSGETSTPPGAVRHQAVE